MPEGLEVFILSKAINICLHSDTASYARGKQLFLPTQEVCYSFGLHGTVNINISTGIISKQNHGGITGSITALTNEQEAIENNNGGNGNSSSGNSVLDWMTASVDQLHHYIMQYWQPSGKQLGTLLLNQSSIRGIGVAWGSEILYRAGGLRPDVKACHQNVNTLATSMVAVREEFLALYDNYLMEECDKGAVVDFINNWFYNLYSVRNSHMCVYKKGTPVKSGGRTWWC